MLGSRKLVASNLQIQLAQQHLIELLQRALLIEFPIGITCLLPMSDST